MPRDVQHFFQQFSEARKEKSKFERTWQEIADVIEPFIALIGNTMDQSGLRGDRRIYDSQPTKDRDTLANALHSSIFPPYSPFVAPMIDDRELLEEVPEMRDWLAVVDQRMQSAYNSSNFHTEANPSFINLVTWGHAPIMLETFPLDDTRHGRLKFKSFSVNEFAGMEDEDGRVGQSFRDYSLRNENILEKELWRENLERQIPGIAKNLKENPNERRDILHFVGRKMDEQTSNKRMEYISVYILQKEKMILNMRNGAYEGFYENPIYSPRWRVNAGQLYAASPSLSILGEAQSLQATKRLRLKALPSLITPPLEVMSKNILSGDVSLVPGTQTKVRQRGSINPIQTTGKLDAAFFESEDTKQNIRQGYHADEFQFPPDLPQMTALEARLRSAINQGLFGPFLSRTDYEWSQPMNERVFWILFRAGEIPDPPVKFDPNLLKFKLIGPLPMAQRFNEVQQSKDFVIDMANLGQMDPVAAAKVDYGAYVDWRAERESASFFDFLRPTQEAQNIVQQQAQLQAAQQAAASAKDAGSAALSMARAEQEG